MAAGLPHLFFIVKKILKAERFYRFGVTLYAVQSYGLLLKPVFKIQAGFYENKPFLCE
jgi:hypothetical protein